MKTKTSDLTGPALDWAVEIAEKMHVSQVSFQPSTDWSQGGPIIEREKIGVWPSESISGQWGARMLNTYIMYGPTPLIAAMRCFVASKLGDEVEVPEELK